MRLKHMKMGKFKGNLGRVFTHEKGIFRFSKISYPVTYYRAKEEFEIVKGKDVKEVTLEEEDKILMSEHEWLGKPKQVHRIGTYVIVEYIDKEEDSLPHFSIGSHSWLSLDDALLYGITKSSTITMFISNGIKEKSK